MPPVIRREVLVEGVGSGREGLVHGVKRDLIGTCTSEVAVYCSCSCRNRKSKSNAQHSRMQADIPFTILAPFGDGVLKLNLSHTSFPAQSSAGFCHRLGNGGLPFMVG